MGIRVGSEVNRKTEVFGWGSWTGRDGSGGGGGSGAGGGLGGVGGGSQARTFWWDLVGMRVGSKLPKTEKRKFLVGFLDSVESEGKGAGGGGGSGAGGVGWSGRGEVEPEGEGSGGGAGVGPGGGLGGVGPKHGAFGGTWWACALVFEPPKTEKQKFVVGVSGQGGEGKAGSGGEAGVALGGGWVGGMRGSSCGH